MLPLYSSSQAPLPLLLSLLSAPPVPALSFLSVWIPLVLSFLFSLPLLRVRSLYLHPPPLPWIHLSPPPLHLRGGPFPVPMNLLSLFPLLSHKRGSLLVGGLCSWQV